MSKLKSSLTIPDRYLLNTRTQLRAKASDISIALQDYLLSNNKELDTAVLIPFRGANFSRLFTYVVDNLITEAQCSGAAVLRVEPSAEQLYIFTASTDNKQGSFPKKKYYGLAEVLATKLPLISDKNCNLWTEVLLFEPSVMILLPVNFYYSNLRKVSVEAVVVLGFKSNPPGTIEDAIYWKNLLAFSQLMVPLLVNLQRFETSVRKDQWNTETLDAVRDTLLEIHDIGSTVNTIGLELQNLFSCANAVVFIFQDQTYEKGLFKYCCFGGGKIDEKCPDRASHTVEEIPQVSGTPVGWTAMNKKILRINNQNDLQTYGLAQNNLALHSTGGCYVQNIFCLYINDPSGEAPLVVELSEKPEGFSQLDELKGQLFAKRVTSTLAATLLLDYRKRALRRADITNEVLNHIKAIRFAKVKQLLDMKNTYSSKFYKRFLSHKFIWRNLPAGQYPGIILYMFAELGFINRWKIRRATLIRFILSIRQGYQDNPYHNWRHACIVTHAAFIFFKQHDIPKMGYMKEIEVFAFMVACLSHDVDHRGVNNHFALLVEPETYHVYKQEEQVMERHHVAVTLSILNSDDCNIVESLNEEEYKEFIDLVQFSIMATDINQHLRKKEAMFADVKKFNPANPMHRKSFMSCLMTYCDLCESAKPWNDYIQTVKAIFLEFFAQGDDELRLGFTPSPIMDRRVAYIPLIEMKFINQIVQPVYTLFADLFPLTRPGLHTLEYLIELWLVATQVFDDFVHTEDPMDILELREMKEESLRHVSNPELAHHASKVRLSIASFASSHIPPSVISMREKMKAASKAEMDAGNPTPVVESYDQKPNGCLRLLDILFCGRLPFYRKGLDDAKIVREYHLEGDFLEERSEAYERKRSVDEHSIAQASRILNLARGNAAEVPSPVAEQAKDKPGNNKTRITPTPTLTANSVTTVASTISSIVPSSKDFKSKV